MSFSVPRKHTTLTWVGPKSKNQDNKSACTGTRYLNQANTYLFTTLHLLHSYQSHCQNTEVEELSSEPDTDRGFEQCCGARGAFFMQMPEPMRKNGSGSTCE